MVGQQGIKLALNLISSHFGNLVSKVCECLLRKGTLTLPEIVRFTELRPQQVKNCLLVLIQHNCVQPFTFKQEDEGRGNPKGIHYAVIFDNILHRIRFPKFLSIVSEQFDKESETLLEGLLQHGRLTLEQIILRAIANKKGDYIDQDALRANFRKLVIAQYVERCPDSVSVPNSQDDNPSARRRNAKSAKFVEPETPEQQAITAAIPAQRFAPITDTGTDVTSEAYTSGKPSNITVGEKRKIEALETDDVTDARICEKEVLWRANFEEFIRHLRHKACVATVRSRHDDGAGTVINAVLEATRRAETKVKTENSVPLSRSNIFEEVIKSEEGRSMTLDYVDMVLKDVGCHQSLLETEVAYSFDLKNILEIAQNDEVELLLSTRYGKDAYKMFRLLAKDAKLMETEYIADTAFVEKKEALKVLYTLWKDDYLQMEKVVSNASAYSQFLLWKVNKPSLRKLVFDEMCHAALNLRLRLAHENEQEPEILLLPREKRIGPLKEKFDRITKVNVLLVSALMKLDDALMLFHDF